MPMTGAGAAYSRSTHSAAASLRAPHILSSAARMAPSHWRLILNGKSTDNEDLREAVGVLRKRGIQLDVRVT